MAEYRVCFRIMKVFGAQMSFEFQEEMPYEVLAKSVNIEAVANLLGIAVDDIEIITPEQYDEEFGEEDDHDIAESH